MFFLELPLWNCFLRICTLGGKEDSFHFLVSVVSSLWPRGAAALRLVDGIGQPQPQVTWDICEEPVVATTLLQIRALRKEQQ